MKLSVLIAALLSLLSVVFTNAAAVVSLRGGGANNAPQHLLFKRHSLRPANDRSLRTRADLTKEQIAEFRELFSLFDQNGDGTISAHELGTVLHSLGENPTHQELEQMIADVDVDGSGHITFDEYLTMMAETTVDTDAEEELREAFVLFDTNGDGKVTEAELGQVQPALVGRFESADADKSGSLNLDEFVAMLKAAAEEADDGMQSESED